MPRATFDAISTVRVAADDPRAVEGIAVPYGVETAATELGREVFHPGAFKADVARWMSRKDGARMAFRPAHREKPVGTVTHLEDTPDGVVFRAVIRETPAGDDYLADVRDGLNGVSIEAQIDPADRRGAGGAIVHRAAKLHAIAGSVSPAYDGARIALRDMEEPPVTESNTEAEAKAVDPIPPAEREAKEASDPVAVAIAPSYGMTITRAEAVYGPGKEHGILRDMQLARYGDSAAAERQSRHYQHVTDLETYIERAGDVLSSEIPGAYPNEYMPGLLTTRILKGRPMANFYSRTPVSSGAPRIFPKVTTSTTVAVQSAEGVNPAASDFATTAVTVTPLLYGAETVVSRQVLDAGDPSAETMIINDMMEAYAQASETVVKTAVEAGSTASGSAITAATPYAGLQANVVAYQAARFKPATGQFVPPALYTVALAQADTTGRPFYTYVNPVNSQATVEAGGASGNILGATEFLSWASTTNVVVTGRPEDFVIFESSIARFSYEAATGPAGVRIGIWAYLAVGTRLGSLKVTAA